MDFAERLKGFQAEHRGLANNRQAFDAKRASEPDFTAEIEILYTHFAGTFQRYCGNCWHDAFMRILTLKNMDKKTQFKVFAGTLLHDPVNRDVKYMLTPGRLAQMGDELALRHLAHNPDAADYFEKPLPTNLNKMIAEYLKAEQAPEQPSEETPEQAKVARSKGAPRTSPKKSPKKDSAPKEEQTLKAEQTQAKTTEE